MVQSWLTTALTYKLKSSSYFSIPSNRGHKCSLSCLTTFYIFWRDGVLPSCLDWSETPELRWSTCLSQPKHRITAMSNCTWPWFTLFLFIYFLNFYWILGFGVHNQSMQDSCVGTHMAVCFAFLLPLTHIWHFSPGYPSPPPPPTGPPLFPPTDPSV